VDLDVEPALEQGQADDETRDAGAGDEDGLTQGGTRAEETGARQG
jgi:hypothetical protein